MTCPPGLSAGARYQRRWTAWGASQHVRKMPRASTRDSSHQLNPFQSPQSDSPHLDRRKYFLGGGLRDWEPGVGVQPVLPIICQSKHTQQVLQNFPGRVRLSTGSPTWSSRSWSVTTKPNRPGWEVSVLLELHAAKAQCAVRSSTDARTAEPDKYNSYTDIPPGASGRGRRRSGRTVLGGRSVCCITCTLPKHKVLSGTETYAVSLHKYESNTDRPPGSPCRARRRGGRADLSGGVSGLMFHAASSTERAVSYTNEGLSPQLDRHVTVKMNSDLTTPPGRTPRRRRPGRRRWRGSSRPVRTPATTKSTQSPTTGSFTSWRL